MTRNAFWGLCIGLCLTGTQAIAQKMESKSIKTTDKTDSISFHIDGITEGETLFTVIGGPEAPVINAGMPGTEGIQGGFEGGSIVKINGVYHMFPTERAGCERNARLSRQSKDTDRTLDQHRCCSLDTPIHYN